LPPASSIGDHAARLPALLALTIAGSDSCGGAGIQADLRAFWAFGVRGATAVTALTAQEPGAVRGIVLTQPEFVVLQARTVLEAMQVGAIKTGMLGSAEVVVAVAGLLESHAAGRTPIVVDPVIVATSGASLLSDDAIMVLRERLVPLGDLLTPNLPEAAALLGTDPRDAAAWTRESQLDAARAIQALGAAAVLVKGGHRDGVAADVLVESGGAVTWLEAPRVDAPSHGTGCTLSAGIAAGLALGWPLAESVARAKDHVTRALRHGLDRPLFARNPASTDSLRLDG
jgi:hydroxymethylpyrimidine/phosphomethylpyrimidine kinase